jgi:sphingosine kinase
LRYEKIQALKRILRLRKYNGSICFVPAPGCEDVGEASGSCADSMQPLKPRQLGYQGPKFDLQNANWRKLNGPFVSVWLHNVPWGAENTLAAPDAKVIYSFYGSIENMKLFTDCEIYLVEF